MSVQQRIAEIEDEMARTQKNKHTMKHICLLKARVAKLKRELIDASSKGGGTHYIYYIYRRWWRGL